MTSCVPKGHQTAITTKALLYLCSIEDHHLFDLFVKENDLNEIWVHWPSIVEALKDTHPRNNLTSQRIINLWDAGALKDLPFLDDELPSIKALNNIPGFEDNVSVICDTFGEYVELRKTYGQEDVKFFRRI